MHMLRTVTRIWIVFLVGAATTVAFLTVTPPLANRAADMVVGLAVFGGGLLAGLALDRRHHAAGDSEVVHTDVEEPVEELVAA